MFQAKPILRFTVRLALLYGLLVIPWPGLRDAYASGFRAAGGAIFQSFGSGSKVRFEPAPAGQRKWDTDVNLIRRGRSTYRQFGIRTRFTGYLPTAALIALVLATPLPWSRRAPALAWGLVLVHVFVVLKVAIAVMREFQALDLFVFGPFWNKALHLAYHTVVVPTVTSCVVPALIWILVSFRRDDFRMIVERQRPRPILPGLTPIADGGSPKGRGRSL